MYPIEVNHFYGSSPPPALLMSQLGEEGWANTGSIYITGSFVFTHGRAGRTRYFYSRTFFNILILLSSSTGTHHLWGYAVGEGGGRNKWQEWYLFVGDWLAVSTQHSIVTLQTSTVNWLGIFSPLHQSQTKLSHRFFLHMVDFKKYYIGMSVDISTWKKKQVCHSKKLTSGIPKLILWQILSLLSICPLSASQQSTSV